MKITTLLKPSIIAATLALLALSGCSGAQSVEQACRVGQSDFAALPGAMAETLSTLTADPEAVSRAFAELETETVALADRNTNREVRGPMLDTAAVFSSLAQLAADESTETTPEVAELLAELMRDFDSAQWSFTELCG